jgi:hypothetical protein
MGTRWRLAVLSVGLAFASTSAVPTSAIAQTRPVTRAPASVSAGAFAAAIVFEGGEIFAGRPGEFAFSPIPANHAGTVHVFGRGESGAFEETAVLGSDEVEVGDGFGMSLAVDGNTLFVGAPKTRGRRGAVYVFRRADTGAAWGPVTTLRSATRSEGDDFGAAVALDGEFALIGSPGREQGAGAVTVFRLLGGAWTEVATLRGSELASDDRFGSALAVDGDRLLVGAPGPFPGIIPGNSSRPREGSVYVFDRQGGQLVESARLTSGQAGPPCSGTPSRSTETRRTSVRRSAINSGARSIRLLSTVRVFGHNLLRSRGAPTFSGAQRRGIGARSRSCPSLLPIPSWVGV